MFNFRQGQLGQVNAELIEVKAQAQDLSLMISNLRGEARKLRDELQQLGDARRISADAQEAIREAERAKEEMFLYSERIGQRVGAMESANGRLAGIVHEHVKLFRALGADAMLRATGGGSVAPPAPSE